MSFPIGSDLRYQVSVSSIHLLERPAAGGTDTPPEVRPPDEPPKEEPPPGRIASAQVDAPTYGAVRLEPLTFGVELRLGGDFRVELQPRVSLAHAALFYSSYSSSTPIASAATSRWR